MFNALARGIPSFGDLAWKAPIAFAGDNVNPFAFPVPILAPVAGYSPGQTLTKNGNGSINSEPPFLTAGLVAGDHILVRSEGTPKNGLWVVTVVGTAGTPWVLTRTTDGDSAAELPTGASVLASAFLASGVIHVGRGLFVQNTAGTWDLQPQLLEALTVIFQATIGDGSIDPALTVSTGITMGTTSAIRGGAGPIVNAYVASTTWNKPAGIHHIEVEVQGGGGGGGGAAATAAGQGANGGGGGGGGYTRKVLSAANLAGASSFTVTRGAAGAAAAAGANAGGTGGASSFSGTGIGTIQGNGGVGGAGQAALAARGAVSGGAGGGASGGGFTVAGEDGSNGQVIGSGEPLTQNRGGNSFLGSGGMPPTASGVGSAGTLYGGGGSGGSNSGAQVARASAAGAGGIVIVTEYYGP